MEKRLTGRLIGADIPNIVDDVPYGSTGSLVVGIVQEWLCLHGYETAVDRVYGPATMEALREFLAEGSYSNPDIELGSDPFPITPVMWGILWHPMREALSEINLSHIEYADILSAPVDLERVTRTLALEYARRHLEWGAAELPRNRGPWVRLYMGCDPYSGPDGPQYAWCGAFVRFCIRQALETLGWSAPPNNVWSGLQGWSVDLMAEWARQHNVFWSTPSEEHVVPGSVFLVHRSGDDWVHTGFVDEYDHSIGVIKTIEGNTNTTGEREGTHVCARYRNVSKLDFIHGYNGVPRT